jgi:hypothetical protein
MKRRTLIIILGAVICAVLVVWIIFAAITSGPSQPSNAQSSQQESIDTSLSLAPGSSTQSTQPSLTAIIVNSKPLPKPAATGCKLSLNFVVTNGNLNAPGNITYQLTAQNLGNQTCRTASISVYYANGETFVSASPKATADGYYWQFGALAAGKEDVIILTANRSTAANAATTDEACLSADNGSDACANAGSSQAATGAASVATVATTTTNSKPVVAASTPITLSSNGRELGVWEWTTLTQMSASDMQNAVTAAAENNFNVIYLTIDDYLTIDALPDGTAKQQQFAAYEQAVGSFLSLAAAKGIAVDAESGSRNWGESGNTWQASAILSFVNEYNQTHAQKFRGVQYDIEPYLLPQYQANQAGTLTQYVQLVSDVVTQDKNDKLPLTIIVPHFYDANEQWTPEITINGMTDYTYRQILSLLNQLPSGDGRIIIMAYRNFATGSDGAIDLSQSEIQEADATNVKVLVAQETGPVTPSYVTFYGLSRAALASQAAYISKTFSSDSSFDGISIDYLDPFLQLPQN